MLDFGGEPWKEETNLRPSLGYEDNIKINLELHWRWWTRSLRRVGFSGETLIHGVDSCQTKSVSLLWTTGYFTARGRPISVIQCRWGSEMLRYSRCRPNSVVLTRIKGRCSQERLFWLVPTDISVIVICWLLRQLQDRNEYSLHGGVVVTAEAVSRLPCHNAQNTSGPSLVSFSLWIMFVPVVLWWCCVYGCENLCTGVAENFPRSAECRGFFQVIKINVWQCVQTCWLPRSGRRRT